LYPKNVAITVQTDSSVFVCVFSKSKLSKNTFDLAKKGSVYKGRAFIRDYSAYLYRYLNGMRK